MALNSSSRAVLWAAAASEADLASSVDFCIVAVVFAVVVIVFAVVDIVVKEDDGTDSLETSSDFFIVDVVTPDLKDPEGMAYEVPDELAYEVPDELANERPDELP